MALPQFSVGVQVNEREINNAVPVVSTTAAAGVTVSKWGPSNLPILVPSVEEYVRLFYTPTDDNYAFWFSIANYFAYGNNVLVTRSINKATALNAGTAAGILVENQDEYARLEDLDNLSSGGSWIARYPGDLGNSLGVSMSDENRTQLSVVFASTHSFSVGDKIGQYSAATPSTSAVPTATGIVTDVTVSPADGSVYVINVRQVKGIFANGNYIANATNVAAGTSSFSYFLGNQVTLTVTFATGNTFALGDTIGQYSTASPSTSAIASATGVVTYVTASPTNGSPYTIKVANVQGTFVNGQHIANKVDVLAGISGFSYVLGSNATTTYTAIVDLFSQWQYANAFNGKPGTSDFAASNSVIDDELHVVIIDTLGKFSGVPGSVLEIYPYVSKLSDAKANASGGNYYKDVINAGSSYVWWGTTPTATVTGFEVWGSTSHTVGQISYPDNTFDRINSLTLSLGSGNDGTFPDDGDLINSFDIYNDKITYEVSLLISGPVSVNVQNEIGLICKTRQDCVGFISPQYSDVIGVADNETRTKNVLAWINQITPTSYLVADSGWKQMYDKYNDKNRWVPLNPDIAGTCAYTDQVADTWWSPMGATRGLINGVIKLAWNPRQTYADQLYPAGVNPVITEVGMGTRLNGDKTVLTKPSAFDRINVRRLFIVVEKAIAAAAKYVPGEFNDAFEQSRFTAQATSYLNGIQAARGITAFSVVCDSRNNTSTIVDGNRFVCDVYIKPARSINFIQLNFIAVPTGVSFSEIGG